MMIHIRRFIWVIVPLLPSLTLCFHVPRPPTAVARTLPSTCRWCRESGEPFKDLEERVRILEIKSSGTMKTLDGIKEDVKDLSKEMNRRFEALDTKLDSRFAAIDKNREKDNETLDRRFEAIDKKFFLISLFVAVETTLSGMANLKDIGAFFK